MDLDRSPRSAANRATIAIVAEGFLSRLSFGIISFALPIYAHRVGLNLFEIGVLMTLNQVVATSPMNDLVPTARVTGKITFRDRDLYAKNVDPVEVRRRIGTIFQKPNPFPKSIYDNIAFGARINGYRGNLDELVERSLRQVALWDEVKDCLKKSGLALSGGQQHRDS